MALNEKKIYDKIKSIKEMLDDPRGEYLDNFPEDIVPERTSYDEIVSIAESDLCTMQLVKKELENLLDGINWCDYDEDED